MRSKATQQFWKLYEGLPREIQKQAREAYRQFRVDPASPGLNFEAVTPSGTIWSARINEQYRVLGKRRKDQRDVIVWFWIGTHNAYDKLLNHPKELDRK